ncbi:MAG: DEAD/DEAH box helicase, partial [Pirellulales bacterium]
EATLYEESGLLVRLPDWWRKRTRPQVGLEIGKKRKGLLTADTMLDFQVQVALGDETLSESQWRQLLAGDEGLVLFKGRWVEVDRDKLNQALDHWRQVEQAARAGEVSFIEGMRLLAGAPADLSDDAAGNEALEWSFVRPGKWLAETLQQLRQPQSSGMAAGLPQLRASLRPYQQTGLDWLWTMSQLRLGACLADDMGLGKTIQVLALLLKLKQARGKAQPSLLVVPASLLANWKSEMARFTPSLTAVFAHASESSKERLAALASEPEKSLRGVDLVVTTYGMLQRQAWLSEIEWRLVVLDEAQAIKNPSTRQTRAVKRMRSQSRVALTGTPVENRLADLWSLFDFLSPGLLGSADKFKRFVKQLESREHDRYLPLRNLVQPYILRRMKTDKTIIADLPDKSEVKAYCGLTKRQTALYQKSVEELAATIDQQEGIERRGAVLAFLMRFKQICNHPSQFLGDGEYGAADSGKFNRLVEICEEIASRQEKVLVFTQFREMTEPLQALLAGVFRRPGLVLHGGTAVGKRKKLVESFQREQGPPFFVLSLKAGGTGLNLT